VARLVAELSPGEFHAPDRPTTETA
jgi:hypothetical protein